MDTNGLASRIVFAGDRQVGRDALALLLEQGIRPLGLILPSKESASHASQLAELCPFLDKRLIWYGTEFRSQEAIETLHDLELDFIICVQFPLIVPRAILNIPKEGVLNLHPAYLPFNRGWHSAIWAMFDRTPYGATLHFMNEKLDMGDIVHQKEARVTPADTGDTLYKRALELELEVLKEALPRLLDRSYSRTPQDESSGSTRRRNELFTPAIQEIALDNTIPAKELIDKLRALTTNSLDEAGYFVEGGRRFRIQVKIIED